MKKIILLFILFLLSFFANAQVTLNLKLFIEGYYAGSNTGLMDNYAAGGCLFINNISTDPDDVDTINVSLVDPSSAMVKGSVKGILKTDGSLTVNFDSSITPGHSYYIRIQHRSAVETWSAATVQMNAVTAYDFSTAQSQAYGGNMVQTQDLLHWALYSGDISDAGTAQVCKQDGVIEPQDYSDMENAVFVSLTGYVCQDITGDSEVNGLDYSIEENNVFFAIESMQPYLSGINEINDEKNNFQVIKCFSNGDQLSFVNQPEKIEADKLILYAIDGRVVFEKQLVHGENFKNWISEMRISSGMYILYLTEK